MNGSVKRNTAIITFNKFSFILQLYRKFTGNNEERKVGVARLKPTRDDNSKGPLIGPSLFYTSKLYSKYIKLIEVLISY